MELPLEIFQSKTFLSARRLLRPRTRLRTLRRAWSAAYLELGPKSAPRIPYLPSSQDLERLRQLLERILVDNMIPFWYPEAIDRELGGYRLHHDLRGRWKGATDKSLVSQSRMLWFSSRLARSPYGTEEHLEAARHGYAFLRDHLWDHEFGGFYWRVDAAGQRATWPHKHLYGQAAGLYALVEYSRVSEETAASELARTLFELIERQTHDAVHGGYDEFWLRDWSAPPPGQHGYQGVLPEIKKCNTHLHLLEAVTTYVQSTGDPLARERLQELLLIMSNTVVRKEVGACTEFYLRDWMPLLGPGHDSVNYGHDLETVWMLIEACSVLGLPNSLLLDLYRCLFEYSVRFGWDRRRGGYYESGPLYQTADRRTKIWWVQAEALLAAMQMYRLTGERFYFDCASRTLDWIVGHQVDWQSGEWHHQINQRGVPQEDKASGWKDPYHNGRAVLHSLEILSQLTSDSALSARGPLVERRTAQPGSDERLGGTASGSQAS